jgi:ComF family protein
MMTHKPPTKTSKGILETLEQWLFPHYCVQCHQHTQNTLDLCHICQAALPWIESGCFRCGIPKQESEEESCVFCAQTPLHFDRLCALLRYERPITHWITRLKFGGELYYGRILGTLLSQALPRFYATHPFPQAVIPVPLHPSRLRQRGFNQTRELLIPLLQTYPIELWQGCSRIRTTLPQISLNQRQRKNNLHRIFELTEIPRFERIAILDDVVTTASTVNALSNVLRGSGVDQIDVWTICRA